MAPKVVVSSRNQGEADGVAAELNAEFGTGETIAKGVAFDLDRLEDVAPFAERASQAFGGVDILVCNAAALAFVGPASTTPPDVFERLLNTNIHHNFRLCEALRGDIASRGWRRHRVDRLAGRAPGFAEPPGLWRRQGGCGPHGPLPG